MPLKPPLEGTLLSSKPVASFELSALNDIDSRLAMELAIDISEVEVILDRYSITAADLRAKLGNPQFRAMVKDFKAVWNSDLSTKERIRVKSQVLVEDGLLDLHGIFKDDSISATARIDAFKTLSRVATTDAPDKEGAAAGERVQISINIPGVEKPVTYEAEVTPHAREEITDGA